MKISEEQKLKLQNLLFLFRKKLATLREHRLNIMRKYDQEKTETLEQDLRQKIKDV